MKRIRKECKKPILCIDTLNCILSFLGPRVQKKCVLFLNKVLLNYYLNSHHGIFCVSFDYITFILQKCKELSGYFDFITDKTKSIILQNIKTIQVSYIQPYPENEILENLKVDTLILRNFPVYFEWGIFFNAKHRFKTLEMCDCFGLQYLFDFYTIFKVDKLILNRIPPMEKKNKFQELLIECKVLIVKNMDLNYYDNIIFKDIRNLKIISCLGKSRRYYSKIVEDNKETIETLILQDFNFVKISCICRNLQCLKVLHSSSFIFQKISKIKYLRLEIDVKFSEYPIDKFGKIENLYINLLAWECSTFENRRKLFDFLKKSTNITLTVPQDKDLYIIFRECIKFNNLRELKILYRFPESIGKIKRDLENYKFGNLNICLFNI